MNNSRGQPGSQQEASNANLKHVKISIDALTNEIRSHRQEQKDRQDGDQIWNRRTAIAAIMYTFITLIVMLVGAYQTYLIRDNNVISQRAFITTGTPQLMMVIDANNEDAKGVSVAVPLINSGNTPTKNLEFFIKCAPAFENMVEPWGLMQKGAIERVPQVIGPHQQVPARCVFTLAHMQQTRLRKARGYLMGEISYRDSLDGATVHKTQFSWEVIDVNVTDAPEKSPGVPNPDIPSRILIGLTPRGQHNCADDDCPK
jgi:hypothetical protein